MQSSSFLRGEFKFQLNINLTGTVSKLTLKSELISIYILLFLIIDGPFGSKLENFKYFKIRA